MRLALAALLAGAWASSAQAACRLALILAMDVSSSVDEAEFILQREGTAQALLASEVAQAILGAPDSVALAVYEWSGRRQNSIILPWTMLDTRATLAGVADVLRTAPRSHSRFPTAMGYALGFGATLMRSAPACDRYVIDLSGDGITNDGFGPAAAYRHFPFANVTVNGLAVLGADPLVEDYYMDDVRHGPGAFVETADGYDGFATAMRRKLFREINGLVLGALE